jgi:hypothetical protein
MLNVTLVEPELVVEVGVTSSAAPPAGEPTRLDLSPADISTL